MGVNQYYKLHGYLEFLPVEAGFVTPVFYRNKQLFMEISSNNLITDFIALPDNYAEVLRIDLGKTNYEVKIGDPCFYAFKHFDTHCYGNSSTLIDPLRELLKTRPTPYHTKTLVRKFVNKFDEPSFEKVSIMIVDDHRLIRESWKFILDSETKYQVIAEAAEGGEAIELAKIKKPQIVLMDINMSPVNGFDATAGIKKYSPNSKVIGVSMHSMPAYATKILQLGGLGYVTKNSGTEEMFYAINEVCKGNVYICDDIQNTIALNLANENKGNQEFNHLSRREIDIIKLIKDGISSKEISNQLNISIKTVEVHRYNILKKLNLKNTTSLIDYVNSNNLL